MPEGGALWFEALGELGMASFQLGDAPALSATVTRLVAAPSLPDAEASRGNAAARLAQALPRAGRIGEVPAVLDLVAAAAERHPEDGALTARLQLVRAFLAKFSGDLAACLRALQGARLAWEHTGEIKQLASTDANLGDAWMHLGRHAEAEAVLRSAITTAERFGLAHVASVARNNLGFVLTRQGRLGEAEEACSGALAECERVGNHYQARWSRVYLAGILRRAGDLAAAERHARAAAEPADPLAALATTAVAETLLARGMPAEAVAAAERALGIVEASGMEEGEAELRLVRAEALFLAGRRAAAAIREARARVLAGANAIGDADLRRSFLENVAEHARTLALGGAWLEGGS